MINLAAREVAGTVIRVKDDARKRTREIRYYTNGDGQKYSFSGDVGLWNSRPKPGDSIKVVCHGPLIAEVISPYNEVIYSSPNAGSLIIPEPRGRSSPIMPSANRWRPAHRERKSQAGEAALPRPRVMRYAYVPNAGDA